MAKPQNAHVDLLASVRTIQSHGLEVSGGFIVGFDEDRPDIFERQIRFIREAAIPTAMVGLLTALPNTRLHQRLKAEGRLLGASSGGNNTHDLTLNFRPRMDAGLLLEGYQRVLKNLYTPSHYFARCLKLIRRMKRGRATCRSVRFMELRALVHSLVRQTCTRYGFAYWSYILRGLLLRPRMAAEVIAMAVKGHHYFTITDSLLALERFKRRLEALRQDLEMRMQRSPGKAAGGPALEAFRSRMLKRAWAACGRIHPDFRDSAIQAFGDFKKATELNQL
jgi:hypothetical protein